MVVFLICRKAKTRFNVCQTPCSVNKSKAFTIKYPWSALRNGASFDFCKIGSPKARGPKFFQLFQIIVMRSCFKQQ
jgi:hypothetical protein